MILYHDPESIISLDEQTLMEILEEWEKYMYLGG